MIWLIIVLIVYVLIVFGLSRWFVPHLGNGHDPLPEKIPEAMENKIDELKKSAKTKEDFLHSAYDYLGEKNRSERLNTIIKFDYLFKKFEEIWQINGYIPCTQSNYLLRIFLIRSGFFTDADIRKRHSFLNFVLHQYLEVNLTGRWLAVEVGEASRGLKIGQHQKPFAL